MKPIGEYVCECGRRFIVGAIDHLNTTGHRSLRYVDWSKEPCPPKTALRHR